jgi:hypothetical protein
MEGASWWNQAFESAGFINAFQIKIFHLKILIQWISFQQALGTLLRVCLRFVVLEHEMLKCKYRNTCVPRYAIAQKAPL